MKEILKILIVTIVCLVIYYNLFDTQTNLVTKDEFNTYATKNNQDHQMLINGQKVIVHKIDSLGNRVDSIGEVIVNNQDTTIRCLNLIYKNTNTDNTGLKDKITNYWNSLWN